MSYLYRTLARSSLIKPQGFSQHRLDPRGLFAQGLLALYTFGEVPLDDGLYPSASGSTAGSGHAAYNDLTGLNPALTQYRTDLNATWLTGYTPQPAPGSRPPSFGGHAHHPDAFATDGFLACQPNNLDNLSTYSVAFWAAVRANGVLFGKLGSGSLESGQGWAVFTQNSTTSGGYSTIQMNIMSQLSGGSVYRQIYNNNAIANSQGWHHYAFTVSNYVPQAMWVDGIPQALGTFNTGTVTTVTNTYPFVVGATFGTASNSLSPPPALSALTHTISQGQQMDLSYIAIWNRLITPSEIEKMATQPYHFLLGSSQNLFTRGVITKIIPATKVFGLYTGEKFGGASFGGLTVTPAGIQTNEVAGDTRQGPNVTPAGLPSREQLGAENLAIGQQLYGIPSEEHLGSEVVTLPMYPVGIPSDEKLGNQGVGENLNPAGIPSAEIIGNDTVATIAGSNLFPGGLVSQEVVGNDVVAGTPIYGGIKSGEAVGEPNLGYTWQMAGIASKEIFGALVAGIQVPGAKFGFKFPRKRAPVKPPAGTQLDKSSSLYQGLKICVPMLEQGGVKVAELMSGVTGQLTSGASLAPGLFGNAYLGAYGEHMGFPDSAEYTDIWNGPISASFWIKTTNWATLGGGATLMGKSDSTDGASAAQGGPATAGWNINCDNWHVPNDGTHYYNNVTYPPTALQGGANNPPAASNNGYCVIKMEFEATGGNKQGGVYCPSDNQWHHVVIVSAGGRSSLTIAETDDFTVYLDGVVQDFNYATTTHPAFSGQFFYQGKYFFGETLGTPPGQGTTSDAGYGFAIGSHPNGTASFPGQIDNVLLWSRAITPQEAQRLYWEPFCYLLPPSRAISGRVTTQDVRALGIFSQEAIGAAVEAVQASLQVSPGGIESRELFGGPSTTSGQNIYALGIVSAEVLGALQMTLAGIQDIFPGAIASPEAIGGATVLVGVPISSGRVFNPRAQYRIFSVTIDNQ